MPDPIYRAPAPMIDEQYEEIAGEPMPDPVPNPGSDEAIELGCQCARMDNNRGAYPPWPPDGWWITQGCPVHAPWQEADGVGGGAMSASDLTRTLETTDAAVWATEFLNRFDVMSHAETGMDPSDQWGLMVSWFANAIERGRAAGQEGER